MERTISGMMGKGSVNHNTRAFSAKNVDRERSRNNVEFCHTDIKKVYHELFDDALECYNAKQKRSDRKINSLMQNNLCYDIIAIVSCSINSIKLCRGFRIQNEKENRKNYN